MEGFDSTKGGFNGTILPAGSQGSGTSFEDLGYAPFSENETYAAGDVVIYGGGLKKFTTAHEGAWDDDDATETSVAEEAASEHAGRVVGDNILDGKISGLSKLVNADGTIEEFDATTRYAAGSYCIKDGYVYRFTSAHEAGQWTGNDAVQTSVFDELESFLAGDNETIHIQLQSSDGELDVEGLQVSVSFEDGSPTQILTADEDGKCSIAVEKNKVVTLSVADQLGYQHVPYMTLRTNVNARYVFFTYEKEISSETCTVQVELVPSGGRPESYSELVGKTVNLILSDGSARSAVTDSNRIATFLNVRKGLEGRTANPKCTGFVTPAAKNFSTNFDTVGVTLTYSAITAVGIFMVNQNGDDVTYEAWDTDDTLIALHIATDALVEAGCDYYIPVEEMISSWFVSAHQKQWATSTLGFPNVPNWNASAPYYDGKLATQNMISDASTLEIHSPAAEFAVEQTFTVGGNIYNGYIPTRDQLQFLLNNLEVVNKMLNTAGFTIYIQSSVFWTCSQSSNTNVHGWLRGTFSTQGSTFTKNVYTIVVPVF